MTTLRPIARSCLFLSLALLLLTSAAARIDVVAHRGFSGQAPENTLAAIRAARGIAEFIEMDVRVTSDGKLVLMHDDTIDRTTNGSGRPEALTSTYIRSLDAGGWFHPAFTGERVPYFSEALEAILPFARPMVERLSGSAELYVAELARLNATERVVVYSTGVGSLGFLRELKRLEPRIELGLTPSVAADVSGVITDALLRECRDVGIQSIHLQAAAVDASLAARIHSFGFRLVLWTVNAPSQLAQLPTLGVQAVLTDFPDRARQIYGVSPMETQPELPPLDTQATLGGTLALRYTAPGLERGGLRWTRDGALSRAATSHSNYIVQNVASTDLGVFEVQAARDGAVHGVYRSTIGGQKEAGVITNLSSRQYAGPGGRETAAIVGFIVEGDSESELLIRSVGPSMSAFGVSDPVQTPAISIHQSSGVVIEDSAELSLRVESLTRSVGAFSFLPSSNDVARVLRLDPGAYTVVAPGEGGRRASILLECYRAPDMPATRRLKNISTRAMVEGEAGIISGFVIGNASSTVMIRGIGPTLQSFGIRDALPDPLIKLFDGSGRLVAASDDWVDEVDGRALRQLSDKVGAFPLIEYGSDAVIVMTLPPGSYTAQLSGNYNTRGMALVEIYELDP